VNQVDDK